MVTVNFDQTDAVLYRQYTTAAYPYVLTQLWHVIICHAVCTAVKQMWHSLYPNPGVYSQCIYTYRHVCP